MNTQVFVLAQMRKRWYTLEAVLTAVFAREEGRQLPSIQAAAKAHGIHPAVVCLKWSVQRGCIPIPFSVYEAEYVSNLKSTTEDLLTDEEMAAIAEDDKNCRLIKGQVFLWPGASDWHDLWDEDGMIVKA